MRKININVLDHFNKLLPYIGEENWPLPLNLKHVYSGIAPFNYRDHRADFLKNDEGKNGSYTTFFAFIIIRKHIIFTR